MHVRLVGLNFYLGIATLASVLAYASSIAHAGTVNGMDDAGRIPGKFIVVFKRDHIAALKNPALTDAHEIGTKSATWQAAKAAADAEVAQMVAKLRKAHPNVKISAVMSHGQAPGFVLKASDEDAKAIADEEDVAEVDADSTSDALKNITMTNSQSPAPSWGLERIDQFGGIGPSAWVNGYDWIATGSGVDVYIIDSGIMTSNVDFGGRATNDADFIVDGNNGWCSSNLSGAGAGHGTEVASIAGGTTYGVAKGVRLHSVRVTGCAAAPDFAAFLEGLEWAYGAAKNQQAVVNISLEYLAGNLYPLTSLASATQTFVTQSDTWLDDMASAGIELVLAAGNDGPNVDPNNSWPAGWNNFDNSIHAEVALVVGATALNSDNIWSGTSLGSAATGHGLPNIFAPGDRVTTAWITSNTATISSQSGTSLAAPHVTGVMALAMQVSGWSEMGCDESFSCVVQQSGYWGAIESNVQGAFNIELSSLVPGNFAPATAATGGMTKPGTPTPAIGTTINTLLLL